MRVWPLHHICHRLYRTAHSSPGAIWLCEALVHIQPRFEKTEELRVNKMEADQRLVLTSTNMVDRPASRYYRKPLWTKIMFQLRAVLLECHLSVNPWPLSIECNKRSHSWLCSGRAGNNSTRIFFSSRSFSKRSKPATWNWSKSYLVAHKGQTQTCFRLPQTSGGSGVCQLSPCTGNATVFSAVLSCQAGGS